MHRLLLFVLPFTLSCAQQNKVGAPPKSDKSKHSGAERAKEDDDDKIIVPQAITGAALHCGALSAASDQLPTAEIGCRISDTSGKRVDPSSLGVKASFSTTSLPSGVKIKQRTPNYVARSFDSIFELSAGSKAEVEQALSAMTYAVELRTIIGNDSLSTKTSSFAQSKIEPKRADWVSYLYGSSPTYVDQVTSLVWSLDNGTGYTLGEGRTHCENLVYADSSNWRLPTIVEMRTAHLDGLGIVYADGGNMNIDSKRFGGYLTSTLETTGEAPVIVPSKHWVIDLGKPSGANIFLGAIDQRRSVICVHE